MGTISEELVWVDKQLEELNAKKLKKLENVEKLLREVDEVELEINVATRIREGLAGRQGDGALSDQYASRVNPAAPIGGGQSCSANPMEQGQRQNLAWESPPTIQHHRQHYPHVGDSSVQGGNVQGGNYGNNVPIIAHGSTDVAFRIEPRPRVIAAKRSADHFLGGGRRHSAN